LYFPTIPPKYLSVAASVTFPESAPYLLMVTHITTQIVYGPPPLFTSGCATNILQYQADPDTSCLSTHSATLPNLEDHYS
jgi:hypothetical protein